MLEHTDLPDSPWWVVEADNKKKACLNCTSHLLSRIPYKDLTPDSIELPTCPDESSDKRPPRAEQNFVPNIY